MTKLEFYKHINNILPNGVPKDPCHPTTAEELSLFLNEMFDIINDEIKRGAKECNAVVADAIIGYSLQLGVIIAIDELFPESNNENDLLSSLQQEVGSIYHKLQIDSSYRVFR